jgi:hypothetical protein
MTTEVDADCTGQVGHHAIEIDGVVELGFLAPGLLLGTADDEAQPLKELQVARFASCGHHAAACVVDQLAPARDRG